MLQGCRYREGKNLLSFLKPAKMIAAKALMQVKEDTGNKIGLA